MAKGAGYSACVSYNQRGQNETTVAGNHGGSEGQCSALPCRPNARSAFSVMVVIHDVLVPFRFLALLGHFLAALLALYAVVRAAS